MTPAAAWAAVDVPTLALLFGLMVVSAQFRLGGFYTWVTRRIVSAPLGPSALLAAVVVVAGGALRPPRQRHRLPRGGAAPPGGLRAAGTLARCPSCWPSPAPRTSARRRPSSATRRTCSSARRCGCPSPGSWPTRWCPPSSASRWCGARPPVGARALGVRHPRAGGRGPASSTAGRRRRASLVLAALVLGFLFTPVPREVLALGAAALLLTSRRMASRDLIGLVDWHLLVLFVGLFVVNHARGRGRSRHAGLRRPARRGRRPRRPALALPGDRGRSRTSSRTCRR